MKRHLAPWLFISCTLLVSIWILLAHRSSQPFKPFTLIAADFKTFSPQVEGWSFSTIPVTSIDPAEPNILTIAAVSERNNATLRLVHGYNMPMCMKIKGYTVALMADSTLSTGNRTTPPLRIQCWRVTSSTGDTSLWLTSMIRAGDFTPTTRDICSMAFPRVDIPDDPRWVASGFTREDLRHPIAATRRWFRHRWNGARTDLLTFLRLRQPAWASGEELSYVTIGKAASAQDTEQTLRELQDLHTAVLNNLQSWIR